MGIFTGKGETTKISGQAVGGQVDAGTKRRVEAAKAAAKGGTTNTGVGGIGTTVRGSVVNGKYIDHKEY